MGYQAWFDDQFRKPQTLHLLYIDSRMIAGQSIKQDHFVESFTSNGDGTDHGWGAHHFVMGGAVKLVRVER